MTGQSTLKVLQFSAVIFGLAGFVIGVLFFRHVFSGIAFMGALLGTVVGGAAAVNCLVINRRNCTGIISLLVNLLLFVIIARELQIIG